MKHFLMLLILIFDYFLVAEFKQGSQCSYTRTLHFGENRCPIGAETCLRLIDSPTLCSNIAYLEFFEGTKEYVFLNSEDMELIFFANAKNIRTKQFGDPDLKLYKFTDHQIIICGNSLFGVATHSNTLYSMYVADFSETSTHRLETSTHKIGQKNLTVHFFDAYGINFVKAENHSLVSYEWQDNHSFQRTVLKEFRKTITNIKKIDFSNIEVTTIDGLVTTHFYNKINDEQVDAITPKNAISKSPNHVEEETLYSAFVNYKLSVGQIAFIILFIFLVIVSIGAYIYRRKYNSQKTINTSTNGTQVKYSKVDQQQQIDGAIQFQNQVIPAANPPPPNDVPPLASVEATTVADSVANI